MALQDQDVVRFDYTLWVEDETKPTDTSIEAVAKEHGIHNEERVYKPMTVSLGNNQIIRGLESHLRSNGKIGETATVEIAAEDAYGPRDMSKVQDIPMAQFRKQQVKPQVGLVLNLGGERAVVTRVAGGRVRVDKNHDLAGKKLRYEYTVQEVITDDKEKVAIVLGNLFPREPEYELTSDGITLEVPNEVRFDQQWPMHKFRVVAELRGAIGRDKWIKMVETFPGQPVMESTEEE